MDCAARCECNKGFTMNEETGECVPSKQCPVTNCGPDQRWEKCPMCEKVCGFHDHCIVFDMCPPEEDCEFVCPNESRCVCKPGFRQDPDDSSNCIEESYGVSQKIRL